MLGRGNRTLLAILAMFALVAHPSRALADDYLSARCSGALGIGTGCAFGTVTVAVSIDGQESAASLVGEGGASTVPVCTYVGKQVPCEGADGWWSAERSCYVKPSDASQSDPLWLTLSNGQSTGRVYECSLPPGVAGPPTYFWSASPPVVPNQASIVQLAGRAVQSLKLRGVSVGMTPPVAAAKADSVGLVGAPNWLWVQEPSPQTWGPVSGTTAASGLSVTVRAAVEKVTWDLGDDSAAVVCTVSGTPYDVSFGVSPSPDCGRAAGYQKAGVYPVTAVAHWRIAYSSNVGVAGTLSMDLTSTSMVTIAEAQVINR